jgi:hypothetical protein
VLRSRMGPWPVLDPGDAVDVSIGETTVFALPGRAGSQSATEPAPLTSA